MALSPAAGAAPRVLLVEDEFIIAYSLAEELQDLGVEIIGPASSVREALALVRDEPNLDGAILDITVQDGLVFPVADALLARGVPIVFSSGYDEDMIPAGYAGVPRCQKPARAGHILSALTQD